MADFVTFVAGVVFGGLASWFITHKYYIKASADQRTELKELREALRPKNTLADFERLLESGSWTEQEIDHAKVWICDSDRTYQIRMGSRGREFAEPWTEVHPDRNAFLYPVYLSITGVVIKEIDFISIDGGRIFVPMAGVRPTDAGAVEYFWNLNSLELKVCRIIGTYYIYHDIYGLARRSQVAIVE